ncbi:hypothetical protein HDU96_004785 [Phlyctochytrium bullatum]|nr:hypothetical protein HDU96_004785 [Phlyctochytrium bullatum]
MEELPDEVILASRPLEVKDLFEAWMSAQSDHYFELVLDRHSQFYYNYEGIVGLYALKALPMLSRFDDALDFLAYNYLLKEETKVEFQRILGSVVAFEEKKRQALPADGAAEKKFVQAVDNDTPATTESLPARKSGEKLIDTKPIKAAPTLRADEQSTAQDTQRGAALSPFSTTNPWLPVIAVGVISAAVFSRRSVRQKAGRAMQVVAQKLFQTLEMAMNTRSF